MRRLISDICLFVLLPLWLLVGASQAQFNNFPPGTFNNRSALDSPISGGATTFDPANKSANITLDATKLIATAGGSAGAGTNVRSTASHATGKYYAELTVTTAPTPIVGFGLVNGTFAIGTDILGAANAVGWYGGSDGHIYINSVAQATQTGGITVIIQFIQGDVLQLAVDTGAQLLWARNSRVNTQWNDDPAANPATGANGVSISALGAVASFVAIESETNGQVVTINFGPTYALTPPTLFGNW